MRFKITLKQSLTVVAEATGHEVNPDHLTIADIESVYVIERQIEKLTGLRCHIEQIIGASSSNDDDNLLAGRSILHPQS